MFGSRGDHVLAAKKRAHGVNGALLIFEEGAVDALVKVIEGQFFGGIGFDYPVLIDHAFKKSSGGYF